MNGEFKTQLTWLTPPPLFSELEWGSGRPVAAAWSLPGALCFLKASGYIRRMHEHVRLEEQWVWACGRVGGRTWKTFASLVARRC
jgi:hypothetical protein